MTTHWDYGAEHFKLFRISIIVLCSRHQQKHLPSTDAIVPLPFLINTGAFVS